MANVCADVYMHKCFQDEKPLLGKKKTPSLFVDIVDDVIRSFPYRNLMSCNFNDCLIVSLSPLFSVSLETSS